MMEKMVSWDKLCVVKIDDPEKLLVSMAIGGISLLPKICTGLEVYCIYWACCDDG